MSTLMKEIPKQIEKLLKPYEKQLTKPQFHHFKTLVSGLIVSEKKTVQEINDCFIDCSKKDQSSLNRFVTKSNWDLDKINDIRIKQVKDTVKLRRGIFIQDDTLAHKTGKCMEKANYHRSGVTKKLEWGHCIVDSVFSNDKITFPIKAEQYIRKIDEDNETPYLSKRRMSLEQVDYALKQGLSIWLYIADAGYYANYMINDLKHRGLRHILGARITNKFSVEGGMRISIEEYINSILFEDFTEHKIDGEIYYLHTMDVYIRGIGKEKLLISFKEGDPLLRVYVTDLLSATNKTLMNLLLKRWNIEGFHRDAKQHLGLEDYQVRKFGGIQVVVLAVLVAYTLLALSKQPRILAIFKRSLETIGEACRFLRLIALKGWNWLRRISKDRNYFRTVLNSCVLVKSAKV